MRVMVTSAPDRGFISFGLVSFRLVWFGFVWFRLVLWPRFVSRGGLEWNRMRTEIKSTPAIGLEMRE